MKAPITRLVGLGSLFLAAWGLYRPRSLGRRMGVSTSAARQVGIREAVVGTLLVARPGPTSLAARTLADLSDAAQTWRYDKRVAASSLMIAAIAGSLAVAARRGGSTP